MSETFKLGEIAILAYPEYHPEYRGQDVEIIADLRPRMTRRDPSPIMAYRARCLDGCVFVSPPHHLRKKHLPPDWLAIARKQTVPEGVDIKSPEYA